MTDFAKGRFSCPNRLMIAGALSVAVVFSGSAAAQQRDSTSSSALRDAVRRAASAEPTSAAVVAATVPSTIETTPADASLASSIEGIVHDLSGAAVTEAAVTLKNVATHEVLSRTSDASGAFSIQNL